MKQIKIDEKEREKISDLVATYLLKLGFDIGMGGFEYLKEAITLCYFDRELLNQITTVLYPCIAKTYEVNDSVIERSIRRAIEDVYKCGGLLELNTLFDCVFYHNNIKFSNSEFISIIVEKVRIDVTKEKLERELNIFKKTAN